MTAATIGGDALVLLIARLGPDAVARMSEPLTADEAVLVDEALARHNGDPVAALGMNLDDDTAAAIRALWTDRAR